MNQIELQKAIEALSNGGINVNGDLVLSKTVQNEIGNVESGGIGIQINNVVRGKEGSQEREGDGCDQEGDADKLEELKEKPMDYEGATIALQQLLREDWFAEVRANERYDAKWTDAFVVALMESEYGENIAREWAAKRNCQNRIKGQVIGTLADAGVLEGSKGQIARAVGIRVNPKNRNKKNPYRTFSDYMGCYKGSKPSYADWVKDYVNNN